MELIETLNYAQLDEYRWQAVERKNPRFDHVFYTGVRTTKIYCKPSCPAKTPKRENIRFYPSCDAAEANGFRACLRCKPRVKSVDSEAIEIVRRVFELLETTDETFSLDVLSQRLNASPALLQRTFKNLLGVSPAQVSRAIRIENFKQTVKTTDVTTALYDSGFGSSRALYERADENLGMTPAQYKRGGKNMKINFTIVDSSLGKMLVAATTKGICKISFGDHAPALEIDLRAEYPAAEISIDRDNILQNQVQTILQNLTGERELFDLPLDVRATAFQLKVWAELRKIPRGETRSYKQIAENLGNQNAVRAVARACATNPVAVINPCHRVVGSDGKMTGYRWGVERKQLLLDQEQSIKNGK